MNIDALLFDLDGVIFTGTVAVPYAVATVISLRESGYRCVFLTNNASRSPREIAAHLTSLGLPSTANDIVTSPEVAVGLIDAPAGSPVLVVGSEWLAEAVRAGGFIPVTSAEEHPVAVVQGFAPTIGWRDLAEASYAVAAGAQWVATNPDRTVPLERGLAPGNGSLVAAVAHALGRGPDVVAGKPAPALFTAAAKRVQAHRPLVVGDRLDTDIEGGRRAGMRTALVLTGVTQSAKSFNPQPDLVLNDLRDLLPRLEQ